MQTVELNHLNHGDVVCIVWPPHPTGEYSTLTGIFDSWSQSDRESGENETRIVMNNAIDEMRWITSGDLIQRDESSVIEATINEDDSTEVRYYLITPQGWPV